MTDDFIFTGTGPIDRVTEFLAARTRHPNLDPEEIYAVAASNHMYRLTVSDLKALVAAVEASPYRADRITDENVQDIVDTAAYGGITYWAGEPDWEDWDQAARDGVAGVNDDTHYAFREREDGKQHYVTCDQIRQATVEIALGKHTNDTIRDYVRAAFDGADDDGIDCGNIDADAADCIVQVACFGSVVYG